jgi:hypothetical protein
MSKTILAFVILFITGLQAMAQCDKKVTWQASKADMFDAKGNLLQSKEGIITVETDPQKITVSFKESPEDGLEGTITEKTCDWKDAFKNGKTVYHTTVYVDGKNSNAIFTVEAKDGKITISVEIEIMEGRKFVIYVDTFEEVK